MQGPLITLFMILVVLVSCTDSSGGGAPAGALGSNKTDEVELPEFDAISAQLVFKIANTDIDPTTISGYIVHFTETHKIQKTTQNRYFINNIPEGKRDLLITAVSSSDPNLVLGVRINEISLANGARTTLDPIELLPAIDLDGSVTKIDSSPAINSKVSISGTKFSTTADEYGRYSLKNVPQGSHTIQFGADGFRTGYLDTGKRFKKDDGHLGMQVILNQAGDGGFVFIEEKAVGVTDTRKVNIYLGVPEDRSNFVNWRFMKISQFQDFSDAVWIPVSTNYKFEFSNVGNQTVFAKFIDINGKESAMFSDSILINPFLGGGQFSINSGATTTILPTVSLTITPPPKAVSIQVAESPYFPQSSWIPSTSSVLWTFTSAGAKSLYVRYKDDEGNVSTEVQRFINVISTTVSIQDAGHSSLSLTWTSVSGASGYNIYWKTSATAPRNGTNKISTNSTTYTHSGLVDLTTYYYEVVPVVGDYEGIASPLVNATSRKSWGGSSDLQSEGGSINGGPQVVRSKNGKTYAVWSRNNQVYFAIFSASSGWSSPTVISSTATYVGTPVIGADDIGNAIVVWAAVATGSSNTVAIARRFANDSWGTETTIGPLAGIYGFALKVEGTGDAVAVFEGLRLADGVNSTISSQRYLVNSGAWQSIVTVGTGRSPFAMATNGGSTILTFQQVVQRGGYKYDLLATRNASGVWSVPVQIDHNDDFSVSSQSIAMDQIGNAIVTFIQPSSANTRGNVFANRYLVGSGWQGPQKIDSNKLDPDAVYGVSINPDGNAIALMSFQVDTLGSRKIYANSFNLTSGWGSIQLLDTGTPLSAVNSANIDFFGSNAMACWTKSDSKGAWCSRFVADSGWQNATQITGIGGYATYSVGIVSDPNNGDNLMMLQQDSKITFARFY